MKKILIVDDEAANREILAEVLEDFGDIRQASNALDALQLLRYEPADLVITDFNMPRMTGLEMAQAIRNRWPDSKIVLCTADTGITESPFVDAVMHKPVRLPAMETLVEQYLK